MERLARFALGAFAGYLLVRISGVAKILAEQVAIFQLDDYIYKLGTVVLLVGFLATIVFSVPVLFAAIKALNVLLNRNIGYPDGLKIKGGCGL